MSEELAELCSLSSGYMSTERLVIAWSSRLRICEAHFQIGAVFINNRKLSFKQLFSPEIQASNVGRLSLLRRGASAVDTVLLTYQKETKQPQRPIAGLPALES